MKSSHPTSPPPPFISIGTMKKSILGCVLKGMNVRQIGREIGRHKSTVQQHLKELQELKLVYKSGYFWCVSDVGKKYLGGLVGLAGYDERGLVVTGWLRNDRAHNIKIKFEVVSVPSPDSWLKFWDRNDRLKNNVFYTQRFGEVVTTFTGRSLIFQLPPMVFDDSELAVAEAGRIGMALKDKYEGDVEGLKLSGQSISAQLISQHHAIVGEPYARFLSKHGISFRGERVEVDSSVGVPELEFVSSKTSHVDHVRYVEMVEDYLVRGVPKPSELYMLLNKAGVDLAASQAVIKELSAGLAVLVKTQLPVVPSEVVSSGEVPFYVG